VKTEQRKNNKSSESTSPLAQRIVYKQGKNYFLKNEANEPLIQLGKPVRYASIELGDSEME
jgi:hypothetical protein